MSPITSAAEVTENNGSALVAARKADHLQINLAENLDVDEVGAGFEAYRFQHRALPEVDFDQVSCAGSLFGKPIAAPILISCMTGGTPKATTINRRLAEAASELGLPMGLGSSRVLIEDPSRRQSFDVREVAPAIPLLANLGAVQLNRGVGVDDCRRLLDTLDADALVLHLNPLQEALQPDGDTCFAGLLGRIAAVCEKVERPVVVKEIGWGLAGDEVRALFDAGVSAVDVAGAGGTSWSEVERHRLGEAWMRSVAACFSGWGIPTATALREAKAIAPDGLVFASGGVRDGIDIAKALALGADLVGLAHPFLLAAERGAEAAVELGQVLTQTLRVALFCVGASSVAEVRGTPRLVREDGFSPRRYDEELTYDTNGSGQFIDITEDVRRIVERSGIRDGQVHVFSNHTTASIRVNENEPLLIGDLREFLAKIAPPGGYEHDDMSRRVDVPDDEPVNGHSHCRHLLLGSSEVVPVEGGAPRLGSWQSLFLIEHCSPRRRTVSVQVQG